MSRKPIIAGNWKMNCTVAETVKLINELRDFLPGTTEAEVLVAPPFTSLEAAADALKGSGISLGAQNMHHAAGGAYTGEISAGMLLELGCRYVIIGHSERRTIFRETDADVNLKINAAIASGLVPILCVGESLQERKANETMSVVKRQINEGLKGMNPEKMRDIVIAYEPIWAIGTGETASPGQAEEVHSFIRSQIGEAFGKETASSVRIQYGGSVKPDNIDELISQEDIDGALVGGASLNAKSFARVVKFERRK